MQKFGMFEAKSRLSQIAEEVRQTGRSVTLTKRGVPYVDVVPHRGDETRRSMADLRRALAELHRGLPTFTAAENAAAIVAGRR